MFLQLISAQFISREGPKEYLSTEKILADQQKEQQTRICQLKLLRNYQGCKCYRSKEIDAPDSLLEGDREEKRSY